MRIAIIGGGASGMLLASMLDKKNYNITIFEKNNKLGKKLLLTGNSKCNFTSGDFKYLEKIYNNNFARSIYKAYDYKSCIEFYKSIGIDSKVEIHKDTLYYYPRSGKATSVYYNLIDKIIANNISIRYNSEVKSINKTNGVFDITLADGNNFIYDIVVLSTGGMSYKKTGSNGSGYIIAKEFGHSIIEPVPGLCSLVINESSAKKLKGVRTDAKVSIVGYKDIEEIGEVQFTEYGISGIPIFNISRFINRDIKEGKKVCLSLDFLIDFDELKNRVRCIPYKRQVDFLCGILPDEIGILIMEKSNAKLDRKVKEIDDRMLDLIYKNIRDLRFDISKYASFDTAQITMGGIDTSEIDINTLESKIIKGLYFTGEVIDIDGKCGGYNLQLAYSSAKIVCGGINGI